MLYGNPISPAHIKPLSADLIKFFEAQRKKGERIVSIPVRILCTPQCPRLPRLHIAMHINAKTPYQNTLDIPITHGLLRSTIVSL